MCRWCAYKMSSRGLVEGSRQNSLRYSSKTNTLFRLWPVISLSRPFCTISPIKSLAALSNVTQVVLSPYFLTKKYIHVFYFKATKVKYMNWYFTFELYSRSCNYILFFRPTPIFDKPERIPQTALSSLDEHKAKSRMSSWYLYWLVQYLLHYRNIPHLLS